MSLTASMWTGVSGLLAHGDRMNIIGNNISNVNTVGFKGQRMDFADFMYQDSFSLSGLTQVGRGVQIGAVMGDFSQGSTETTTDATDLAIGGRGFFKVKPQGSDLAYYTRAGNFRFNSEGYLCDPNGYTVQGWKVDNTQGPTRASGGLVSNSIGSSSIKGSGVSTDVKLDTWTVDPLQTTKLSFQVNLSKDKGADKARDPANPFAALLNTWDGTQPAKQNKPYISEDSYSYQTSIDVYDEAGGTHTLTVYFDKVSPNDYTGSSSESMWEYVVTMDPSEDLRKVSIPDPTVPGGRKIVDMKDTASAGMLMSGTLTFDSQGKLSSQSAYVLNGTNKPLTDGGNPPRYINGNGYRIDAEGNPVPELDPANPADFMFPTEVSNTGFPMLVANFTGIPGAQTVGSVPDADKYLMEIDFGLKVSDYADPWKNHNSLGSTKYPIIANPVDGLDNPASTTVPKEKFPPSRQLTHGDRIDQGDGVTPRYIYNNPGYTAAGAPAGTPPYVYGNQGAMDTAYTDAITAATTRLGRAATAADLTKEDWPTTAAGGTAPLAAADPPKADTVANIKPPAYRQPNAFTSYKGNHSTQSSSQNGYGFGNLMNYTVDGEGVLYGIYSNGVNLPLYQLTLYDFTNKQGLRREGGNLFSQTRDSGDPSSGAAGTSGFGAISGNSLEGSNVDLSREFVYMITTQRGFQSNSKVITTTDTMLDTVINMKR